MSGVNGDPSAAAQLGATALVSGEEEPKSPLVIPEAGQALPVATALVALVSCAASSDSAFPACVWWDLRAHCPALCLSFPSIG